MIFIIPPFSIYLWFRIQDQFNFFLFPGILDCLTASFLMVFRHGTRGGGSIQSAEAKHKRNLQKQTFHHPSDKRQLQMIPLNVHPVWLPMSCDVRQEAPRIHHASERMQCLAVSEDSVYLAAGTIHGRVFLWHVCVPTPVLKCGPLECYLTKECKFCCKECIWKAILSLQFSHCHYSPYPSHFILDSAPL